MIILTWALVSNFLDLFNLCKILLGFFFHFQMENKKSRINKKFTFPNYFSEALFKYLIKPRRYLISNFSLQELNILFMLANLANLFICSLNLPTLFFYIRTMRLKMAYKVGTIYGQGWGSEWLFFTFFIFHFNFNKRYILYKSDFTKNVTTLLKTSKGNFWCFK